MSVEEESGEDLIKIIKTGIPGFDDILGGGLPVGSCVLLMLPPTLEGHLFCLEYIYRGILNDEPGLFVTMDYSPEDLKIKALKYGWILVRGEQKGILRWIDGYSYNADKDVKSTDVIKRISGSIALSDLTIGITEVQQAFHRKSDHYRFVVDSLSTLLIYNNPNTIYRFLRVVVPKFRISGGVGFFVLGIGMHEPQVENTLRYMLDGTIMIDENLVITPLSLPIPGPRKKGQIILTNRGFKIEPL